MQRERGSFGQVSLALSTGFPRSRLSRIRDAVHAQAPDTELLDSVGPSLQLQNLQLSEEACNCHSCDLRKVVRHAALLRHF